MVFVTALLALHLLPHIRSVKVVIDGTIDFGPNWNLEYDHKPTNGFQSKKIINDNPNILRNSENVNIKASEGRNDPSFEVNEDTTMDNEPVAIATDESSDDKMNEERVFKVTRLFKTENTNGAVQMFKKPRKIKYETEVINFINHVKNESLKMFDNLRKKFQDKAFIQKIDELRKRYANKFGKFENETKHHTIRTKFGHKKVILNTIDYSNKIMNRLVNRFKIDIKDSGHGSGLEASKTFQEHKNSLREAAYQDACTMLGICRHGDDFTDHIGEIITNLLIQDDSKVQLAVEAIVKTLKAADLRQIMDAETHQGFNKALSTLEELIPFDQKVVLMASKLLIESRHEPIEETFPGTPWLTAIVAFYDVMEELNKKVILDPKDWSDFKNDFYQSLVGGVLNINDVLKQLMDRVEISIDALDAKTVEDIKNKLRLCVLNKTLRINLNSYVHF